MATNGESSEVQPSGADGKALDRRANLLTALIAAGVTLLAVAIGGLITFSTTDRQLSGAAATSQAEFVRQNRQEVYARFVAKVMEFQDRTIEFSALHASSLTGEVFVAEHEVFAGMQKELGLAEAALKLVASGRSTVSASQITHWVHTITLLLEGKEADHYDSSSNLPSGVIEVRRGVMISKIMPELAHQMQLAIDKFINFVRSDLAIRD